MVSDSWRGGTRHHDFRHVPAPQHRLGHHCHSGTGDAVRARIFRMHRRIVDRLPCRVELGGRVFIDIAVANRANPPPQILFVLRFAPPNLSLHPPPPPPPPAPPSSPHRSR